MQNYKLNIRVNEMSYVDVYVRHSFPAAINRLSNNGRSTLYLSSIDF